MFQKMTDSIRTHILGKMKTEYKREYQKERRNIEVFRIKMLAVILALFELVLIIQSLQMRVMQNPLLGERKYLFYYFVLLAFLIFYVALFHFIEIEKIKVRDRWIHLCSFVFFSFLLVWSALVSMVDLTYGATIMTYILTMVVVSTASASVPSVTILSLMTGEIFFLLILWRRPINTDLLFIYQTNSIFCFVFSLLMVYFMNRSRVNHFCDRMKIKEQNNELILLSEELKLYNVDLKKKISTDYLTKVLSKGMIEEKLLETWTQMKIQSKPLTVMMLDVDYFKNYNDYYGHQLGDDCLKILAAAIHKKVESRQGFMARFGGEEFLIVIPRMDKNQAIQEASNIKTLVESLNIEHKKSRVSNIVTVSIGVCCLVPSELYQPKKFIFLADQALYLAKKKGRNTFFLWEKKRIQNDFSDGFFMS